MSDKQVQRAGNNSQQLQAARDIHVTGVSAVEVVAIVRNETERVKAELTAAAIQKAEARIEALTARVIDVFSNNPDMRQAFADPDFQYSLRDATRTAASNDDEHTEQLLVDLLCNRATEGNSARARLATSHAIRAADKLSLDALNGLTALWATSHLTSKVDTFAGHFETAQRRASNLIDIGLPNDDGWVSDIDVLGLVRVQDGFSRMSYEDILRVQVSHELVTGIDPTTSQALIDEVISTIPQMQGLIVDHPLKPSFVKLAGKDREDLLSKLPTAAAESAALQQLIGQNGYGMQDNTASVTFAEAVSNSEPLSTLAKWWNVIPAANFTAVGQVVGFVNTRRYLDFDGATSITELLHRHK